METTRLELSPPSLQEIAQVLAAALPRNYVASSATVVDCPDLRKPPFHLAAEGLCGGEVAADVGGHTHLVPRPRLDKNYSLPALAKLMQLSPDRGSLIGAGAGPNHVHGYNSELSPNLSWKDGFEHVTRNLTHSTRVVGDRAGVACGLSNSADCSLMVNLFGSEGRPGPVIKVTARGRCGNAASFTEFLQAALREAYGPDRQVSLGGIFLLKAGRAHFHVMPHFPTPTDDRPPFEDQKTLDTWLTFHDFAGPIVCLSVLHSADPQKLGIRLEHTHCFSGNKPEGGHYHYDLGDEESQVEYEGYFNVAHAFVRIDKPKPGAGDSQAEYKN
ncbi:mgc81809 protein [Niveomyces insectorum RCEF 264]|uniref:Mgc81809 protein n=1 Tax=Niveomyces insectorum RCEF 264 TaxID=1081102 RepID=A0A167MH11_9HYPO|nr:mgc81809 protein [Niveomyces insectorum RCEF 264]